MEPQQEAERCRFASGNARSSLIKVENYDNDEQPTVADQATPDYQAASQMSHNRQSSKVKSEPLKTNPDLVEDQESMKPTTKAPSIRFSKKPLSTQIIIAFLRKLRDQPNQVTFDKDVRLAFDQKRSFIQSTIVYSVFPANIPSTAC